MIAPDSWNLRGVAPGVRVGLLGGSFDPPHSGHMHISQWALKLFRLDQVWWLISPRNPLKRHKPAPVSARLSQAQRKFAHPRIVPTDLETRIGADYSFQTLQHLNERCPHISLVWLMGADNLVQFHRWQRWREVFQSVPIGILARHGYGFAANGVVATRTFERFRIRQEFTGVLAEMNPPVWAMANIPLHGMSSTEIRETGGWRA